MNRYLRGSMVTLVVVAFIGLLCAIPSAAKSSPAPTPGMAGMNMGGSAQPAAIVKGVAVAVVYENAQNKPGQKWEIVVPQTTYKVGVAYTFQVVDKASGNHEFMVVDSTADVNMTKMNASMEAMPGMQMSMDNMDSQPGVLGVIESGMLSHNGKPSTLTVTFKKPGTYWIGCYAMDPIKDAHGHVVGYVDHNALGMRAKIVVVK